MVLIVAGAAWYLLPSPASAPMDSDELTSTSANENESAPVIGEIQTIESDEEGNTEAADGATLVVLTDGGFVPETITVPKGGVVTWINEGRGSMWVASDIHPTHEVYSDTTRSEHCAAGFAGTIPFDQCENGTRYTFTFDQSGTWHYHNHLDSAQTGTVIVE